MGIADRGLVCVWAALNVGLDSFGLERLLRVGWELVQWTNRLLPATGGSGLRPGGATHTLEPGLPVSDVSLQW